MSDIHSGNSFCSWTWSKDWHPPKKISIHIRAIIIYQRKPTTKSFQWYKRSDPRRGKSSCLKPCFKNKDWGLMLSCSEESIPETYPHSKKILDYEFISTPYSSKNLFPAVWHGSIPEAGSKSNETKVEDGKLNWLSMPILPWTHSTTEKGTISFIMAWQNRLYWFSWQPVDLACAYSEMES